MYHIQLLLSRIRLYDFTLYFFRYILQTSAILTKASNAHTTKYGRLLGVPFGAEMRKLDPFEPDLVNTSGGKLIVYLYGV